MNTWINDVQLVLIEYNLINTIQLKNSKQEC